MLGAPGDQTQFTASAWHTNGTQRDVTAQVAWTSTEPAVATIDQTGLVTARGLGVTDIRASLGDLQDSQPLIISPVPTYSAKGWVRSPGSSAVEGVLVSEPVSGRSTLTNRAGEYALIALVGPRLFFEKAGYEPVEITAVPNGVENDAALQQLIRIEPGGEFSDRLAPHDVEYTIDGLTCGPCRRVRILAARAGRLTLRLIWTLPHAQFRVHAGGRVFSPPDVEALAMSLDLDVGSGETVIYVGANRPPDRQYFDYWLTASFVPR